MGAIARLFLDNTGQWHLFFVNRMLTEPSCGHIDGRADHGRKTKSPKRSDGSSDPKVVWSPKDAICFSGPKRAQNVFKGGILCLAARQHQERPGIQGGGEMEDWKPGRVEGWGKK
jgi:hypothetical protein